MNTDPSLTLLLNPQAFNSPFNSPLSTSLHPFASPLRLHRIRPSWLHLFRPFLRRPQP